MKSSGMDSKFEAWRQEKNYRRRQRMHATQRPGGNPNSVWEKLQEAEEVEIHDRILTREVHDFFSDATKIAADIVQRVATEHEQEVNDHLRNEMEEFLRSTIQRATAFIQVMGTDGPEAERILEPDMKNIVGRTLDDFRYEGTAQLEDKHFGQDPFATDVEGAFEHQGDDQDQQLHAESLQTKEPELALQPTEPTEAPLQADEPAPPPVAEEELPLAAAYAQETEAPVPPPPATPAGMTTEEKDKLRHALRTMVKQGLMTKDQAQAAWREKVSRK